MGQKLIKLSDPFYINEDFKWYIAADLQEFIETKNDFNLPALKGITCCIVINENKNISDYVLIDNNQNVLYSREYPREQHEVETRIKMIKIKKYYDQHEGIAYEF